MRINKSLLTALAATLALGSCTDFTNGFDEKRHEFAENFANEFGAINPDQDWNMAARYSATIHLGNDVNGELKLYSDAPGVKGSQYLGHVEVVNGVATLDFDAVKGSKYFYAAVKNTKGRVVSLGYYIPNGNKVEIADEHLATRATSSPVTKGEKVDLRVERIKEGAIEDFLEYYGDGSNKKRNYYTMCQDLIVKDEQGYDVAKWDIYGQGGEKNHLMYKKQTEDGTLIPNLYRLNNVDFTHHDAGYTGKFLKTIFGDFTDVNGNNAEGIYKEGIDHVALMHQAVKDVKPDVLYTVAEGGGEVELDCIWRGTQGTYDFFGYYYYDGNKYPNGLTAEELWKIDKYILIDEKGAGSSGVFIGGAGPENATTLTQARYYQGNELISEWKPTDGMECASHMNNNENNLIRGTKIKLTNFDGSTPSYHFNENTKIGFFFGWNMVTGATTEVGPYANRIFFSDCAKTYQLFRRTYFPDEGKKSSMTTDLLPASFLSSHDLNDGGAYEGPDVRPFANTFKFRDLVILGFGDEVAGDKDLNDICFIVNGHIEEPGDITPDNIPEPEAASWLMACEDLGNTDDIDFNDVVFKVSHVANEPKATITALASGGTLPVELTYDGQVLTGPNKGTYFNSWFGDGTIDNGQPINAGTGTVQATGKSIEIPVPVDFSLANATVSNNRMGGFALNVYDRKDQNYTTIVAPLAGDAPQMICMPSDWIWPNEKTSIKLAYSLFEKWCSDNTITKWYKHYDASKLVKNPSYTSLTEEEVLNGSSEEPETPGGGGEDGGDDTDYSQYGTEVALNSSNEVSLDDLRNIATEGPISVTAIGHVNQWASANIKLSLDKDQGYGYQVVDVDNSYKQAAQTTEPGGATVAVTTSISAEQYADLLASNGYRGGLIVQTGNITSPRIFIKKESVNSKKRKM